MSRRPIAAATLLALATALAACVGGPAPQTHYYTLDVPRPSTAASGEGLTVGVPVPTIDPPYDQDRLVYRRGRDSSEVGFYPYRRWAAPLGRMLPVALARGLEGAPGIAAIEPAAPGGKYDAVLRGRLLYLEEVDRPGSREARVGLALELVEEDGAVLWSDTLSASAGGPAGSGDELMALVERAFGDLVAEARRRLAAALGR